MASENIGFTAFSSENLSDLNNIKSEWSQKYLNDSLVSFGASNTRNKIVTPKPSQNVVGVGIGEKVTEGAVEGILALKFFVRMKIRKISFQKPIFCRKRLTDCRWMLKKREHSEH